MLTRSSYIPLLAVILFAFPAVALGATKGGSSSPTVADARVVAAGVGVSGGGFEDMVAGVAGELREREAERIERKQREKREAFARLPGGVTMDTLEAIAECESGGDPTIVSSDGSYRGKYQFSVSTWETVGGSGDPAAASEAEQDYRAALLYAQSGSSPWPVCG